MESWIVSPKFQGVTASLVPGEHNANMHSEPAHLLSTRPEASDHRKCNIVCLTSVTYWLDHNAEFCGTMDCSRFG